MRPFGELEAVIMDRVWSRTQTVSVREVLEDLLRERRLAYTTVMSVMDNLHRKGALARERDGRAYRYWAVRTREEHGAQLMREALDASGDRAGALVRFFEQMNPKEVTQLRAALDAARRKGR
ncbi:MAG: BlaI/MecI/CopY family transcriptional regulator [Streptomycetales bacterium]